MFATNQEIVKRVVPYIKIYDADVTEDSVHEGTDLQEDNGMDSVDVVEFIMAVEDEFNLEIPDEATEKMKTLGDFITYIADNFE